MPLASTGKVATTEQAQEVHAFIRGLLVKLFGAGVADKVRILYGGSMKPSNAPELLAQKDIDGGLIGGASLEARSFVELITAAAAVALLGETVTARLVLSSLAVLGGIALVITKRS